MKPNFFPLRKEINRKFSKISADRVLCWSKKAGHRILPNLAHLICMPFFHLGPFHVKTDELTDLDKLLDYNKFTHAVSIFFGKKRLEKSSSSKMFGKVKDALKGKSKPEIEDFDELIQKIVKKLFSFLEYHIFVEKERKGYGTIALNAIAAYLCNLGGEFKEMGK